MAPRKSLPAASGSTPRRAAAVVADSAIEGSSKRGRKRKLEEADVVEEKPEGIDPDKELEAWQDFAAEHYEMVEQLPLELHRNFRLLKELDLGCVAQMDKLHVLIRDYINQRTALVKPPDQAEESAMDVDQVTEEGIATQEADTGEPAANDDSEEATATDDPPPEDSLKVVGPGGDTGDHSEVEDLIPVSDGEGGLVAVPESAAEEPAPPRKAFPSASVEKEEVEAEAAVDEPAEPNGDLAEDATPLGGKELPWTLLPDIGKLAREIVRNAEEKVAVAVGAYNAIDRHIRALDSALSAQEASILLGLRPSTFPSSALDASLHPDGTVAQDQQGDDGAVTIGMGGGRRKKQKKGRKSEAAPVEVAVAAEIPGLEGIEVMEANADPNEPRYCVCNRVSFGVMIGCDNDDCPTEWFHLPCVGLLAEPTGKWLCPTCRPHGVGVAAAAATVGAGSENVKVPPSGQKSKKAVPKGARRRR